MLQFRTADGTIRSSKSSAPPPATRRTESAKQTEAKAPAKSEPAEPLTDNPPEFALTAEADDAPKSKRGKR